jgi:hypothetical protein
MCEAASLTVHIDVVSYKLHTEPTIVGSPIALVSDFLQKTGLDQFSPNAPHFVYCIRVTLKSPITRSWELYKRFSEIATFDRELGSLLRKLPSFPPRGTVRDLSDSCGRERMLQLNKYFGQLCKMEEVVTSSLFLTTFGVDASLHRQYSYTCIGTIRPMVNLDAYAVVGMDICGPVLVTALTERHTWPRSVGTYVSSLLRRPEPAHQSKVVVWSRLPETYLYEVSGTCTIPAFRITTVSMDPVSTKIFICSSNGRVGCVSYKNEKGVFSANFTYLPGVVFVGPVTAIAIDGSTVYICGEDGVICAFNLETWSIEFRTECNSETGVFATALAVDSERKIIYVGLSNGLISVFVPGGSTMPLRVVTLLQGPPTPVTSLAISGDRSTLFASHSAGIVDSVEGSNSVQPWSVGDILKRGSEKLKPIGPVVCTCMQVACISNSRIFVLSSNGAVVTAEDGNFKSVFSTSDKNAGSIRCYEDTIFVATNSSVEIFSKSGDDDLFHNSSTEMSSTVVKSVAESSNIMSIDEDLSSWARA